MNDCVSCEKIGTFRGSPVFEVETLGGFCVVASKSGVLGSGSCVALARRTARLRHPGLQLSGLAKSAEDRFGPQEVAKAMVQTDRLRKAWVPL